MGTFDDEVMWAHKARHPDTSARGREPAGTTTERRILQLQRDAGNAGVAQLLRDDEDGAAVQQLISGGGRPLEPETRAHMESSFGEGFQDVRVHTGGEATESAQRLGASAYTVGNDVVFSEGRYDPTSTAGEKVLAHELAHVVQQRSGPVEGTDTGTGVKVSDPNDRFEQAAEATAEQVTSGRAVEASGNGASGDAVQRQAEGEEEELDETAQGMWVQREELPEEEMEEG